MSKRPLRQHQHKSPTLPRGALLRGPVPVVTVAIVLGIVLGLAAVGFHEGRLLRASAPALIKELGAPRINDTTAPGPAPEGMVWIPGGIFVMGNEQFPDALPTHTVEVAGFWMDRTEVTNAQFRKFVEATNYVTVAEKVPEGKQFPKAKPDELVPFSGVFTVPDQPVDPRVDSHLSWWKAVDGACWKHPEGPGSDLKGRDSYPVVHVSYPDALAYAAWADKRLPTEAEWEFAARGGLDGKKFCWGDEFSPGGKLLANTWQGPFPNKNTLADGFAGIAPVASFPPNGYGLHDMAGNVWEWCSDWYHYRYYAFSAAHSPQGPRVSFDPNEPETPKRVQRGGSYLCCDNYCERYQPGARGKGEPDSAMNHVGFRCVRAPAK